MKVLDRFFEVVGDLKSVELIVVERNGARQEKVCGLVIDADDINRGKNNFDCVNRINNMQGLSIWKVRLRVIETL